MINKKVLNSLVEKFGLQGEDIQTLTLMAELHHDTGPTSHKDFEELVLKNRKNIPLLKALHAYQNSTIETPPKWKTLIRILTVTMGEMVKIWKKESKKQAKAVLENSAKNFCIVVITGTKYGAMLYQRLLFTEVGFFSGHVSDLDRGFAEEQGFKPLSNFEKWMMKEVINSEKAQRQAAYRQSCVETLGEDPEIDWFMM